jgi:UDP-glucose 4-epimerase
VFKDADGIFHHAAIVSVTGSVKDPLASHQTNLTGTLNVLLAARDCQVKKVVFASSSAIYGEEPTLPKREDMPPAPLSPYAVSKLAGEYYCKVFSELFIYTVSALLMIWPALGLKLEYAVVLKFITRI